MNNTVKLMDHIFIKSFFLVMIVTAVIILATIFTNIEFKKEIALVNRRIERIETHLRLLNKQLTKEAPGPFDEEEN